MKKILFIAAALSVLCAATVTYAMTDEDSIRSIDMGTTRKVVHRKVGMPVVSKGNGSKEIYELTSGNEAVLIYERDILQNGYIVIK